jgi:hypothetical protein
MLRMYLDLALGPSTPLRSPLPVGSALGPRQLRPSGQLLDQRVILLYSPDGMRTWTRDPHAGGVKIPEATQDDTRRRILAYANKHYAGTFTHLVVRFRGQFCYIDAYKEPDSSAKPVRGSGETLKAFRERLRNSPTHLCRLRYCGRDEWSAAFFAYSSETYEPCALENGGFYGTPEDGFRIGAVYLRG